MEKIDRHAFDDILIDVHSLDEHRENITTLQGMGYQRQRAHFLAMEFRNHCCHDGIEQSRSRNRHR